MIAIDDDPTAVRVADVELELAASLKANFVFIHVSDPALNGSADIGVAVAYLLLWADRDAKRLVSTYANRLPVRATALEFLARGAPSRKIMKAATE